MAQKVGSLFGGSLLVAGSCIGAGVLALPVLTGLAGFVPSLFTMTAAWAFMTATAFLLVEAGGWFQTPVNYLSMVGKTLGPVGKGAAWVLYLFLFYAALVAYIAGSSSVFSSFFGMPSWSAALFFVLLFSWVIYMGTRSVDLWNRCLMFGKIGSFIALAILGARHVDVRLLAESRPQHILAALPVLVFSFGWHNMIPSLTHYMKGDLRKVRLSILGGSLIAFAIYLIWEIVCLGIIPLDGPFGLKESLTKDREASQALAHILGSSWVSWFAQALAFFAILTSFLAQALSLVHFLADGFHKKKRAWDAVGIEGPEREHIGLCALALVPPLVLALVRPQLFFAALGFAGGICAVLLFGILPVCMVWVARYNYKLATSYRLPGGKISLCCIFVFALFIFCFQLANML